MTMLLAGIASLIMGVLFLLVAAGGGKHRVFFPFLIVAAWTMTGGLLLMGEALWGLVNPLTIIGLFALMFMTTRIAWEKLHLRTEVE